VAVRGNGGRGDVVVSGLGRPASPGPVGRTTPVLPWRPWLLAGLGCSTVAVQAPRAFGVTEAPRCSGLGAAGGGGSPSR